MRDEEVPHDIGGVDGLRGDGWQLMRTGPTVAVLIDRIHDHCGIVLTA